MTKIGWILVLFLAACGVDDAETETECKGFGYSDTKTGCVFSVECTDGFRGVVSEGPTQGGGVSAKCSVDGVVVGEIYSKTIVFCAGEKSLDFTYVKLPIICDRQH